MSIRKLEDLISLMRSKRPEHKLETIRDESAKLLEARCQKLWRENEELRKSADPDVVTKISAMEDRIRDLEATLESVLREARGDGRDATTSEHQALMRTARAILENKI